MGTDIRDLQTAVVDHQPSFSLLVQSLAVFLDEVAAELERTLDFFKVPKPEKAEVLAAFAAHKDEVTAGYVAP